jgi:hypothetical protein
MVKVIRDADGRVIYHGDGFKEVSYLYGQNGIVCEQVYTKRCRNSGRVSVFTWRYDGRFLHTSNRRNLPADWWIANKTAQKISDYYRKHYPAAKSGTVGWKSCRRGG